MNNNTIGLIAGNGRFPIMFAQETHKQGRNVTAIAIREETSPELANCVDKIFWIGVGELKKVLDILIKEQIKEVVMAGQIKAIRLFKGEAKPDSELNYILKAINTRQPYIIFREVSKRLRKLGIRLLASNTYLSHLLAEKGVMTVVKPTAGQLEDIKFGKKIAKKTAQLNIGQTVVVSNKVVLAIEAIEGTDQAIKRAGTLAKEAVVVKASRPHHDMRFDIPVIGPQTIRTMQAADAKCLAVEAGKSLLIDRDQTITLADNYGICITAF